MIPDILMQPNDHKIIVKVRADHLIDGSTLPYRMKMPDGTDIRFSVRGKPVPAPATKAGGQGIRYTIEYIVGDVITQGYLFNDRNEKWDIWFLEV